MVVFKRIIKIVLLISIILLVFFYFQRNKLPEREEVLDSLYQEPLQQEVKMEPFQVEEGEFAYEIVPRYSYELYGLVVSYHDSESWLDVLHKEDPLNTKDLCVVWGDNIKNGVYQNMKFTHGEFTCYAEFKSDADSSWYSKFSGSQLSNNHLLPKDEYIYKAIKDATTGDQIYFKGYLVNYSVRNPQGEIRKRSTSTIRADSGCEVVYVTDFQILKKGKSVYSSINRVLKYLIVVCLVLLLIFLFKPRTSKPERVVSSNKVKFRLR